MTGSSFTRPLALVGLSGTGKSTVGRLLAAQLGCPFYDTDALIVAQTGRTVAQVFAEEGEARFREREADALSHALDGEPAVVATGGGVVLRPESRALLRGRAFVVWLDAPTDALLARLQAHDEERPLLAGTDPAARLEGLRAARAPLYAEIAHARITTDGRTPADLCAAILHAIKQ